MQLNVMLGVYRDSGLLGKPYAAFADLLKSWVAKLRGVVGRFRCEHPDENLPCATPTVSWATTKDVAKAKVLRIKFPHAPKAGVR